MKLNTLATQKTLSVLEHQITKTFYACKSIFPKIKVRYWPSFLLYLTIIRGFKLVIDSKNHWFMSVPHGLWYIANIYLYLKITIRFVIESIVELKSWWLVQMLRFQKNLVRRPLNYKRAWHFDSLKLPLGNLSAGEDIPVLPVLAAIIKIYL